MRIEELYIGCFGKIEDRSIQFEPGFNVIYGENEAGKTTIQVFIKAMLTDFMREKSIRENERNRYLPWSGERAFGTLTFTEHDGTRYLIKRSFGAQKGRMSRLSLTALQDRKRFILISKSLEKRFWALEKKGLKNHMHQTAEFSD